MSLNPIGDFCTYQYLQSDQGWPGPELKYKVREKLNKDVCNFIAKGGYIRVVKQGKTKRKGYYELMESLGK